MAKKKGKTKNTRSKRKATKRRDPMSQSALSANAKKHGGVGVLL